MWLQPGGEMVPSTPSPTPTRDHVLELEVVGVCLLTITGLQEFSVYIFTITASIGVGSSPPASVLVNTSSAGELDDLITRSKVDLGGGHLPPSSIHLIMYSCLHY